MAVGLLLGGAPGAPPVLAAELEETPADLPDGDGRDTTFYACTACHGTAIIKAQGLSRERWNATIDDMVERNRMPALDAADRAIVVDYLATAFPPRQRQQRNPFLP